ncbi:MAG: hypothetical protein LBH44_13380 [Treponema sp.]|jgi:hypothetical protein|nr:hypothetical protein [Treponema sp.]
MKESKLLVLGIIALMLAGGLVLASCDIFNCPEKKGCITNSAGFIRCFESKCAVEKKLAEEGVDENSTTGTTGGTVKCDC